MSPFQTVIFLGAIIALDASCEIKNTRNVKSQSNYIKRKLRP